MVSRTTEAAGTMNGPSGERRRWMGTRLVGVGALIATTAVPSVAAAQLATRHYLAPYPGYNTSNCLLELSSPVAVNASYTVRGNNGDLFQNGGVVVGSGILTGTVVAGAPFDFTFTRESSSQSCSGMIGSYSGNTSSYTRGVDGYGLIVESQAPVVVTHQSLRGNNKVIATSKGGNALGRDFYAWSAANGVASSTDLGINNSTHFVSIMAIEPGTTTVEIEGSDLFNGFDASSDTGNDFTLTQYQTLTVTGRENVSITGTHITSDQLITVTSGDNHVEQIGNGSSDGAADQLVPVDLAGVDFVVGSIGADEGYGDQSNRYVQIVGVIDGTQIQQYDDSGAEVGAVISVDAGGVVRRNLTGDAGRGHYFSSTNDQKFLMFLNSSGDDGTEMGGAQLPALKGEQSSGRFCSGADSVEFTVPDTPTGFLVYVPHDQLSDLEIDNGDGWKEWDHADYGAYLHASSPNRITGGSLPTNVDVDFLLYSGDLGTEGQRIAFRLTGASTGRMHVSVGTAFSATSSFGFWSDYHYGFLVIDPTYNLPTDRYTVPDTVSQTNPRPVRHCVKVNSACAPTFRFAAAPVHRAGNGTVSNFSDALVLDEPEDPSGVPDHLCFDFTPDPVVGSGVQDYDVDVVIEDTHGDQRRAQVRFTFEWADDENDGIPDALDIDDDNDGIVDSVELGGTDLSGDSDYDGILDYEDEDFAPCASVTAGRCDSIPSEFDADGDGTPNHLDVDADDDGVFDLIEGNDTDVDGITDWAVADLDGDGRIDAGNDANGNGLDDLYDADTAAVSDRDGDSLPDYLDADDDGDGVATAHEDYQGLGPAVEDTDRDGTPDYLDFDDDDDQKLTEDEQPDPNGDGDPSDAVDSDGAAPPDYLERGVPFVSGALDYSVDEGVTAAGTVASQDDDGDTVTFLILGGDDGALFTIDEDTGDLAFLVAPDYEAPADDGTDNVYHVTVQVTDGRLMSESELSITVTNVDEPPAIAGDATTSVVENTTAVTTLTAADPELGAVGWSVGGGADGALFVVDSLGNVSFAAAPDFENPWDTNGDNVYEVTIQVEDPGSNTATHTILVTVTDDSSEDSDGDGLSDGEEISLGLDPHDADDDDDGAPDGDEPSYDEDTDGDGLINALDPDSDDDGLFDGTELGFNCDAEGTDIDAGHCRTDADPSTMTDPLDFDTDDGGVGDGAEDANLDGRVDEEEGDPNDPDDDAEIADTDDDGLSDATEETIGSDPDDADTDDDGVVDGDEVNPSDDTDGDGLTNALDPDSDDDGLFDGTELGFGCDHPSTDLDARRCRADADEGATTTSPVLADTDRGGVADGDEDTNHNGQIDERETDPNDPADDRCTADADCGDDASGLVCDGGLCVLGCRGAEGNGCPEGFVCSSADANHGDCVGMGGAGGAGGSAPDPQLPLLAGSGCGCSMPQRSTNTMALAALAGALVLAARRRRRRGA